MSSKQIMKKVTVSVMNIKDYTNEEVLLNLLISYYRFRADLILYGHANVWFEKEYVRLKAEVLERMEK